MFPTVWYIFPVMHNDTVNDALTRGKKNNTYVQKVEVKENFKHNHFY